jgi:hypothetical protein
VRDGFGDMIFRSQHNLWQGQHGNDELTTHERILPFILLDWRSTTTVVPNG